MDWEHTSIERAAAYLREMIDAGAGDDRTRAVYEGLLDVLDPVRHATRNELASAADAVAAIMHPHERRGPLDRRGHNDRRLINLGPAAGGEHRKGQDRRVVRDRRSPLK
jgi:hypothetical protein